MSKFKATIWGTVRRWRDSNGNTYHRVRLIVADRTDGVASGIWRSSPTYGYDSAWEQTAIECASRILGIPEHSSGRLHMWCSAFGIQDLGFEVTDVARKRDL